MEPSLQQLNEPPQNPVSDSIPFWNPYDPMLITALVAVFCLVFLLAFTLATFRSGAGLNDRYFKLCAVTLIVGLATMITVAGYSSEQSNAALGLLGTVAGYLLGKSAPPKKTRKKQKNAERNDL
ncbi:hypothetical protein ACSQ5K_15090 [Pseudomonas sp. PhalM4]